MIAKEASEELDLEEQQALATYGLLSPQTVCGNLRITLTPDGTTGSAP